MTTTTIPSTVVTSVVSEAPEVSAPVRLPGQRNSEVLFGWLVTKQCLWMLEEPHSDEFERIVGTGLWIRLSYRLIGWKRDQRLAARTDGRPLTVHTVHAALEAPADPDVRQEQFVRLKTLLEKHFFDESNQVEKPEASS